MAIGNISHPASVQANLSALTNNAQLLKKNEQQLATGKSVNSPSDNAVAFYAAQALLQQADDLSNLKDGITTSLSTLNSTSDSISSITEVVKQLQGITTQALSTTDPTARASLAAQYNALLPQLDQLAKDATFNGTNLLNGAAGNLTVNFNPGGTSSLTVQGVDATSNGLGIDPASFATTAGINAARTQLSDAISSLNTAAAGFGSNAAVIQTNQSFTAATINNLQTAAGNLTGSDPNEASANLLALEAQNQLSVVSLNISGQHTRDVLKLF